MMKKGFKGGRDREKQKINHIFAERKKKWRAEDEEREKPLNGYLDDGMEPS